MKVLLTAPVIGLGSKGDIKEVSKGYAENFLFPKKLALDVSSSASQHLLNKKEEVEQKKTSALFEKIEKTKLEFKMKSHDNGNLYGSIGSSEIMEQLSTKGISISKNQIVLEKPLRKAGSYSIEIKLSSRLIPVLKIKITPEE